MSTKTLKRVENVVFVTSEVIEGVEFEFLARVEPFGGLAFEEVSGACQARGSTVPLPNSVEQSVQLFERAIDVFEIDVNTTLNIFVGKCFPLIFNS